MAIFHWTASHFWILLSRWITTEWGQINILNATAISDLVESTVPLVEDRQDPSLSSPNWDQAAMIEQEWGLLGCARGQPQTQRRLHNQRMTGTTIFVPYQSLTSETSNHSSWLFLDVFINLSLLQSTITLLRYIELPPLALASLRWNRTFAFKLMEKSIKSSMATSNSRTRKICRKWDTDVEGF